MKIAIVGNSHVGMLKAAASLPEFAAHEFLWLAKAAKGMERVTTQGSRVLAGDQEFAGKLEATGMETEIDLNEVDLAVFVGNTASAFNAANICRTHVVAHWLSDEVAEKIAHTAPSSKSARHFITETAFRGYLEHTIHAGLTYQWITALRTASQTRIAVVPQPFPALHILSPEMQKHRVFRKIEALGVFDHLGTMHRLAHQAAFADLPDVHVQTQRDETIDYGLFTRAEFTQGSMRLDQSRPHVAQDTLHANAQYGALVLRGILAENL